LVELRSRQSCSFSDPRRSLYVSCMGTPCAKFYCCYLADRGLHPSYVQVSWCRHVGIARIGATGPGCMNFVTWKQGIIFVPNLEFLGLVVKDRTRVGRKPGYGRWRCERLSRDPPFHIRSSRSQTSGANAHRCLRRTPIAESTSESTARALVEPWRLVPATQHATRPELHFF
jgi:hypothetical protein